MEDANNNSKYVMVFYGTPNIYNDPNILVQHDFISSMTGGGNRHYDLTSQTFLATLREVCNGIKMNRNLKFSHLYAYLTRYRGLPSMTATEFGKWIEERTKISYETVRKSGDYTKTTIDDESYIKEIGRYFMS